MNLNRQPEHAADAHQAEEYQLDEVKKIWLPRKPVFQHEEEYSSEGFDILSRMQERHFWYLGRHRFLLAAVRSVLKEASGQPGLCHCRRLTVSGRFKGLRLQGSLGCSLSIGCHRTHSRGAAGVKRDLSALRPGGLRFITAPALRFFRSYNDDLAKHLRRYFVRGFREPAYLAVISCFFEAHYCFQVAGFRAMQRALMPPGKNG